MKTLYTYGYIGTRRETLEAWAKVGAKIVDIRISPYSRNANWRQDHLAMLLGEQYVHIRSLGNRNYNGSMGADKGIVIADLSFGLELLGRILTKQPCILLCACDRVKNCHRRVVAEAAAARWPGLKVIDLKPDELPEQPSLLEPANLLDFMDEA